MEVTANKLPDSFFESKRSAAGQYQAQLASLRGRAANNCTTCFSGLKQEIEVISITVTFASQSSADLSSGRRPMSKSAEFCDANVIVVEQ